MLFSLPTGTKMFQFPAFASLIQGMTGLQPAGLSHSEIRGSKAICASPRLIAAYHVLHRLQEPRHPPYALSCMLSVCKTLKSCSVYAESVLLRLPCCFSDCVPFLTQRQKRRFRCVSIMSNIDFRTRRRVENNGFEPLTPCLQSRCSSQLS